LAIHGAYSCIFHPCNYARAAFSTPAFSVAPSSPAAHSNKCLSTYTYYVRLCEYPAACDGNEIPSLLDYSILIPTAAAVHEYLDTSITRRGDCSGIWSRACFTVNILSRLRSQLLLSEEGTTSASETFNPLGNYSATSNNMKLVHWPLTGGLLHWHSEEGTGQGRNPHRPLLAVPNVTAHPSTASVL